MEGLVKMRVKLIDGPKDNQTIICPDDTLVLVYPASSGESQKYQDQEKYFVSHGVGVYQKSRTE